MMQPYTVGEAARMARVTVRALHHYDDIGLLSPSERSDGGYRLYTDADLRRLYQILFYREVGFSLDEIAAILAGSDADALTHLRRQEEQLLAEEARIAAMLKAVRERLRARREGRVLTMKDEMGLYGNWSQDPYAEEARERWGHTEAYRQSARRTKSYTSRDWEAIKGEMQAIDEAWVAVKTAGTAPDSAAAMDVAERHRHHLTRWFYDCPPAFHAGLGRMFVDDPRFKARFDALQEGLAEYVCEAIHQNAIRQTGE